jgi:hypothetical protein
MPSKKARNKHEELIQKIAVPKGGYIETYLVNETIENVWPAWPAKAGSINSES